MIRFLLLFIFNIVDKFKKHFIYWSNECKGDVKVFREEFVNGANHYCRKFVVPQEELERFRDFLDGLLGTDAQAECFVHGTFTSLCESFHSLCNKFAPKVLYLPIHSIDGLRPNYLL